jgi:hypothetical protein
MNFEPLFTTARVVTAIYRITSTTLLLYYIAKRMRQGREIPRANERYRELRGYVPRSDRDDP